MPVQGFQESVLQCIFISDISSSVRNRMHGHTFLPSSLPLIAHGPAAPCLSKAGRNPPVTVCRFSLSALLRASPPSVFLAPAAIRLSLPAALSLSAAGLPLRSRLQSSAATDRLVSLSESVPSLPIRYLASGLSDPFRPSASAAGMKHLPPAASRKDQHRNRSRHDRHD